VRKVAAWAFLLGVTATSAIASACSTTRAGFCAKQCTKDADCCPEGLPDCPGPYPENFVCDGGLCKAPLCSTDADCATLGAPGLICGGVDGFTACIQGCSSDADCSFGHASCTGRSDEGKKICVAVPCVGDGDCVAGLHCLDDGRCGCTSDAECGGGKSHCIGGTCGCGGDADCKPNLDVCLDDPAFRYPPSATTP
jgi:hypothetical protein